MNSRYRRGFLSAPVVALGLAVAVTACDLKVSNPGPVSDDYLNVNAAHDAVVNGAIRAFNDALGTNGSNFAMCGAVVSREWFPSGQRAHSLAACRKCETSSHPTARASGIVDSSRAGSSRTACRASSWRGGQLP